MAELPKRGLGVRILMVVGVGFAFIWAVSILALIFGVFVWNREARRDVDTLQQTRLPAVQAIRVVAPAPEPVVVIATPESGDYESAVLKSIYAQVNPSVVNITALSSGRELNTLGNHNFNEEDLLPAGGGSGFVWDEYGHIVTNHL
jgi:S1-C subfamily serine protease